MIPGIRRKAHKLKVSFLKLPGVYEPILQHLGSLVEPIPICKCSNAESWVLCIASSPYSIST